MKPPARRFVLIMLGISAFLVGGPVLLNYFVDPYDRFGNNRMGVYIFAEREVKATGVERYPHDALLVGNSRIAIILNSQVNGFRFFNAAFSAATAEEVYWFIHHHARKQELVVLGIDLGMKDPATTKGDIFRRGDWDAEFENLVNLQTLEYSFKTMFSHWSGRPSRFRPDGSFELRTWVDLTKAEDPVAGQVYLEIAKQQAGGFVLPPPEQMSFYRKISEVLRERGITCVVVVPPMHEAIIRNIEAMHLQGAYQAWLDQLKTLFPNVVDLSSGSYAAASNFYVADPLHFKADVGVRFMNEDVVPAAIKAMRERAGWRGAR